MVQHREVAVVIMTWLMSLESQFSSMRLREADITGSVVNIFQDIADAFRTYCCSQGRVSWRGDSATGDRGNLKKKASGEHYDTPQALT